MKCVSFLFLNSHLGKEKQYKNQTKACSSIGNSRDAENIPVNIKLQFMMLPQCSALHRPLQRPKEAFQVHQILGLHISMPFL